MTKTSSETTAASPIDVAAPPNLLSIAWQRKSLVCLGTVVGLILAGLYAVQMAPTYQTTAQLLVIKNYPDTLQPSGFDARYGYSEDYLATHQTLIKSAAVVAGAQKRMEAQGLSVRDGRADTVETLIRSLTVSRDTKDATGGYNNILNITHRGPVEAEGSIVLSAVIDSYKQFLEDAFRRSNDDTLELITKARDALEKDLAQKQQKYKEFRSAAPLVRDKRRDDVTLNQDRLASIEARRARVLLRRAAIEAHLTSLNQKLDEGGNVASLVTMAADFAGRSRSDDSSPAAGVSPENQPATLLAKEQELLQKYGEDHPQVQAIRKQLALAVDPFKVWNRLGTLSNDQAKVEVKGYIQAHIDRLKSERDALGQEEEALRRLTGRFQDEAKVLTNYEIEDETLRDDLDRTRKFYDTIIKRLQEVNLVKEFRGYDARVISPPRTRSVMPSLLLILFAGAFVGTLGGLGVAYVSEVTDRSFRTAEEIHRRLGLTVIGQVPLFAGATTEPTESSAEPVLSPALCTYHRPRSPEAEAYRGVRTAVFFAAKDGKCKVIQVTSPNAGDGKTTLACNLAVSIAQSGKRVLLIDADFRRPRVAAMFGVDTSIGLASVVGDEAELQDTIRVTAAPNLWLIPCGAPPSNPAERLNSPRFKELVALLRERYDFVLIDTPPLLAVTDPCIVTACVDGVLLTMRLSKNGRPEAERAKGILDSLSASVLGIVVNGLEKGHRYGSYYGSSPYNYGYVEDDRKAEDEQDISGAAPPPVRHGRGDQSSRGSWRGRWFRGG